MQSESTPSKIGPLLREQLARRAERDQAEPLSVLVRVAHAPTPQDREALTRAGLHIQGVVGPVMSGEILPESIPAVAAIEWVTGIDVQPVYELKSPDKQSGPRR